jgi:hypothetical protein
VCLDETSKQMIVETREPIPAKPGREVRHDYEYERIKKASDCRAATQPLRAPRDNQKKHHKIVAKLDLPHNDDSLPTVAFPFAPSRFSSSLSRYTC